MSKDYWISVTSVTANKLTDISCHITLFLLFPWILYFIFFSFPSSFCLSFYTHSLFLLNICSFPIFLLHEVYLLISLFCNYFFLIWSPFFIPLILFNYLICNFFICLISFSCFAIHFLSSAKFNSNSPAISQHANMVKCEFQNNFLLV